MHYPWCKSSYVTLSRRSDVYMDSLYSHFLIQDRNVYFKCIMFHFILFFWSDHGFTTRGLVMFIHNPTVYKGALFALCNERIY